MSGIVRRERNNYFSKIGHIQHFESFEFDESFYVYLYSLSPLYVCSHTMIDIFEVRSFCRHIGSVISGREGH